MTTGQPEAPNLSAVRQLPVTDFAAQQSSAGRAWIASLPVRLVELAERWHVAAESGVLGHGYNAVVIPVRRDTRPLALKLVWPAEAARDEITALGVWRGRGAVELIAADVAAGALLLERLDPERSLQAVPVLEAGAIAGALVRRLAVVTNAVFPSAAEEARDIAAGLAARQDQLGDPVPAAWITMATELAGQLATPGRGLLIHRDVHYENILAGDRPGRPWVAIDPKPALGVPERSVAELLWTRVDEVAGPDGICELLDAIVRAGELDQARAARWAFVRSIDYWLWGLENNLTVDPVRCERIAAALAPSVASR